MDISQKPSFILHNAKVVSKKNVQDSLPKETINQLQHICDLLDAADFYLKVQEGAKNHVNTED